MTDRKRYPSAAGVYDIVPRDRGSPPGFLRDNRFSEADAEDLMVFIGNGIRAASLERDEERGF